MSFNSKPIPYSEDTGPGTYLPESAGVYFFLDRYQKPLYIGKAGNIKKRVLTHDYTSGGILKKYGNQIRFIRWELTGNNTIASLLEDHRIKSYWPEFNRAQKSKPLKFSVEYYRDMQNRWRISVASRKSYKLSGIHFHRYHEAFEHVADKVRKYELNGAMCSVPFNHETIISDHQSRFERMIREETSQSHFDVFYGKGREKDERTYILVANGVYLGFGFTPVNQSKNPHYLKDHLVDCLSSPVTEKVIRSLYEKNGPEFSFTGLELNEVTQKMKKLPIERKGTYCIPFA